MNARKGWIEGSASDGFLVGARNLSDKEHAYYGPTARVYYDDTWLNIVTDDYEAGYWVNLGGRL